MAGLLYRRRHCRCEAAEGGRSNLRTANVFGRGIRLLRRYAPRSDRMQATGFVKDSGVAANSSGFSLIELLVVVVVVGILAAVAMNSMSSGINDLRRVRTERELDELADAIVGDPAVIAGGKRADFGYVGDIGAFPPNLTALVQNPGYATWDGPYVAPGFVQDTAGYKYDEWGKAYGYSGGITITSTGSGGTIARKIADASSDYLSNTYRGEVRDASDSTPGPVYADSITVAIRKPNGSGGVTTSTVHPDSTGEFTLGSLPVGVHPLQVVFEPNADTITRYLTILPRHKSSPPDVYRFSAAYFAGGGSSGCGGVGADTLRPTGTGTLDECGTSGCAAAWQCVDDTSPDNDGSYIQSSGTSWTSSLFTTANPIDTSCKITRVTVCVSARKFVKDAYMKTQIRTGGVTVEGSEQDLDDHYRTFDTPYALNPVTGVAWTWSDVIGMEIGISLRSTKATHAARCSAVWLVVEYGK